MVGITERHYICSIQSLKIMKKFKRFIVSFLFVSICFYIAGSVAAANFAISNWDKDARGIVAAFWIIGVMVSAIATLTDIGD